MPESWKIHNVFYVILLRPYVGDMPKDMPTEEQLEAKELDEILVLEQILTHKERKVKGKDAGGSNKERNDASGGNDRIRSTLSGVVAQSNHAQLVSCRGGDVQKAAPLHPTSRLTNFSILRVCIACSEPAMSARCCRKWRRSGGADAVSSMVYEANARMRDPVYGCKGAIVRLQQQVLELEKHLALSQAAHCLTSAAHFTFVHGRPTTTLTL
ncbi:hypothetical protein L7F22_058448 [Adiantum nelumboides]|nr:hypothetical protein [Adiantum nelumboides]